MKRMVAAGLVACSSFTASNTLAQETLESCRSRYAGDPQKRLECYDSLAGGATRSLPAPAPVPALPATNTTTPTTETPHEPSLLAREWLLGEQRVSHLRVHRPSYLVWRWTDRVNQTPASPAPGHTVAQPQQWQAGEFKFQLSAKADVARLDFDDLPLLWPFAAATGFDSARLWIGYTQQSYWQALNSARSAAFRETNYEPEAIVSLRHRGWADPARPFKLLNLGFSHQSNGRSLPESRSWNRFYVQAGFEYAGLTLMPRAWVRFRESDDDNPDLERHVGRLELLARKDRLSVLVRSNTSLRNTRGYVQLDWALPSAGFLKGLDVGPTRWFLQVTSGYGESLIDYNHRQTTIGLGLAYGLGPGVPQD